MVSYKLSGLLPAAAMVAASSRVSRPIGRGIDDMEREDVIGSGPSEDGRDLSQDRSELAAPQGGRALLGGIRLIGGVGGAYPPLSYQSADPVDALQDVEDRRLFHPATFGPDLRTVRGSRTRLDASSLPNRAHIVKFVSSRSVITCVRRRVRRQVLLAKGKGGANRYRPPTTTEVCE